MSHINHYITKIEGHGKLNINFHNQKATLEIAEGERLIEGILLGRPYYDAPFITSRICGVCPIAHNMASIISLENAFKIEVDSTTKNLRNLLICSQVIQSHTLHLYFLALSDYIDYPSALSLAEAKPQIFSHAIKLKKTADSIAQLVSGRNVHPITTQVGGFTKIPTKSDLKKLLVECNDTLDSAIKTLKLFSRISYPKFQAQTKYLTLSSHQGYTMNSDTVETSSGISFKVRNYTKNIIEKVLNGSPTKVSTYKNKNFMLGALARLSIHSGRLNPKTKKLFRQSLEKIGSFPAFNSFHNNFAQAVEIVHFLEEAIKVIKKIIDDKNYIYKKPQKIKLKHSYGFGAIEAPRGILYHFYEIDPTGIIRNCNIITPTAQSLNNLNSDVNEFLKEINDLSHPEQIKYIEMLIRAYDPCITCSVH